MFANGIISILPSRPNPSTREQISKPLSISSQDVVNYNFKIPIPASFNVFLYIFLNTYLYCGNRQCHTSILKPNNRLKIYKFNKYYFNSELFVFKNVCSRLF